MLLIIGFLFMVFIIFIATGSLSGMGLGQMIDLPSALIVIVSLIFFLILSKSGSVIGRYFKRSFTKGHTYTESELAGLSAAIGNTIKFTLGTGGVGFLFGFIAMFMNLQDRQMLGPNLAVSLFTVLYSVTISCFVFFPTQVWAENKLASLKDDA
ncbi:MAG: hypothetical protein LBQ94_01710 [Treponema sp.]|nr:hypothetical protein [Treponema sp.]